MRAIHHFFLAVVFLTCGAFSFWAGVSSVGVMVNTVTIESIDSRITDERTKPGKACIEICHIPEACFDDTVQCVLGCVPL